MNVHKSSFLTRLTLSLALFWLTAQLSISSESIIAQSPTIFLPLFNSQKLSDCGSTEEARQLVALIREHAEQQRNSLYCDPLLTQIATEKAIDMATRDYFSHLSPEGYGPNYLASEAGFLFPAHYRITVDANNIESLAGGLATALGIFNGLLNSPAHHAHMLGASDLFRTQDRIGIGMYFDLESTYGYYWVIFIAEKG